jgi:hypothetical protein
MFNVEVGTRVGEIAGGGVCPISARFWGKLGFLVFEFTLTPTLSRSTGRGGRCWVELDAGVVDTE